MRISYIANTTALGGAERYLLTLADGLTDCDCRVYMPESPAARDFASRSTRVDLESLPTDGYSLRPSSLIRSMWFYKNFKEGILHFNLSHPCASAADALAAKLVSRCPIVVTTHLPTIAASRREKFSARLALEAADHIITVCRSARDYVIGQGIFGGKVTAIYNGIADWRTPESVMAEIRAEIGAAPENLIIGTVARLEGQKGLDILLNAFAALTPRYPEALLVIVGEGGEEAKLKRIADETGVAGKVRFLGWRDDSRDLISIFDIFALPSLFESFPFTVVEAMMAGKSVIASDVGGVGEAVIHQETGLLIKPGSVQALAQALSGLLGSSELRVRMGDLARRKAQEQFSSEAMVRATHDLYRGILSGSGVVSQK
ncbi:MAG: glycosyltransferase family 4 protein [Armatimonadetes bacterium]|nr:glycosyltransferase family 4 protein [Armatimonadota bacterium]